MCYMLLFCVFAEVDFEKYKMLEIFLSFQKSVNLECKTWHTVYTHASTSCGRIPFLGEKNIRDGVILVHRGVTGKFFWGGKVTFPDFFPA